MGFKINLTGKKFNRLLVLEYSHSSKNNGAVWKCLCDCGKRTLCFSSQVSRGHVKSCGCLQREKTSELATHRKTSTVIYRRWAAMKSRCNTPSATNYNIYGGRGITYCPEWETFENFYNDMGEGFSDELELDRINVNGDYCKENCRWTTHEENNYNKTRQLNNTSGKSGVSFNSKRKQWRSYINKDKKRIELGYFDNYKDAVEVRVLEELELYGYTRP